MKKVILVLIMVFTAATAAAIERPYIDNLIRQHGKQKIISCLKEAGDLDRVTHYINKGYFTLENVHPAHINSESIYRDMCKIDVPVQEIGALIAGKITMKVFKERLMSKDSDTLQYKQRHYEEWAAAGRMAITVGNLLEKSAIEAERARLEAIAAKIKARDEYLAMLAEAQRIEDRIIKTIGVVAAGAMFSGSKGVNAVIGEAHNILISH